MNLKLFFILDIKASNCHSFGVQYCYFLFYVERLLMCGVLLYISYLCLFPTCFFFCVSGNTFPSLFVSLSACSTSLAWSCICSWHIPTIAAFIHRGFPVCSKLGFSPAWILFFGFQLYFTKSSISVSYPALVSRTHKPFDDFAIRLLYN